MLSKISSKVKLLTVYKIRVGHLQLLYDVHHHLQKRRVPGVTCAKFIDYSIGFFPPMDKECKVLCRQYTTCDKTSMRTGASQLLLKDSNLKKKKKKKKSFWCSVLSFRSKKKKEQLTIWINICFICILTTYTNINININSNFFFHEKYRTKQTHGPVIHFIFPYLFQFNYLYRIYFVTFHFSNSTLHIAEKLIRQTIFHDHVIAVSLDDGMVWLLTLCFLHSPPHLFFMWQVISTAFEWGLYRTYTSEINKYTGPAFFQNQWELMNQSPTKLSDKVTFGFSCNRLMKETRHLRPGGFTNSVADKRFASSLYPAMIHDKASPLTSYSFKVPNYEWKLVNIKVTIIILCYSICQPC